MLEKGLPLRQIERFFCWDVNFSQCRRQVEATLGASTNGGGAIWYLKNGFKDTHTIYRLILRSENLPTHIREVCGDFL